MLYWLQQLQLKRWSRRPDGARPAGQTPDGTGLFLSPSALRQPARLIWASCLRRRLPACGEAPGGSGG